MRGEKRRDARLVTNENEAQRRMALKGDRGARDYHLGSMIAPHGVER